MKYSDIREVITLKYNHLSYKIGKEVFKKENKDITKFLLKQPPTSIIQIFSELSERIKYGNSFLLARLGGTEGRIAGQYCEKELSIRKMYDFNTVDWLFRTSGFFADDYKDKIQAVDEYARLTLDGLKDCDYLSAMFPPKIYMPYFFKYYAKNAIPTFSDFGPYFDIPTEKTWVGALKGKKVLVINSFTDSIEYQYKRKDKLVKDKAFELPDFELITYKTYVTQVGERPGGFKNSFQVLEKMLSDIKKIDFDVALIGAGAYGFPIAVEIKRMGKIAIETCGKTPTFFGVYGERDLKDGVGDFMTDAWIRPMEEPPKKFKEIENGCYW